MADSKITGLSALTAGQVADATDLLCLVDVSDTTMFATGTNKKVTRDALIPQLDVTDGTVAASKAVVLSANKGQDVLTLANAASAAATIATDHTAITAVDDGSSVHLMATKDDNGTETIVKLAEQPDLVNLSSNGPVYSFDGVNDYVNLDLLASSGRITKASVSFKLKNTKITTSNYTTTGGYLFELWQADNININAAIGHISGVVANEVFSVVIKLTSGDYVVFYTQDTKILDGLFHNIAFTINGTTPLLYIDGAQTALITHTVGTPSYNGFDIGVTYTKSVLGALYQGSAYVAPWGGEIAEFTFNNLVYTAAEFSEIALGNIPAKYQWGSQTAMNVSTTVTTAGYEYTTFDGASATGFHAISDGTGTDLAATADELAFIAEKNYAVSFTCSAITGTAPDYKVAANNEGAGVSPASSFVTVVEGQNYREFTLTIGTTGVILWRNVNTTTEYTISNLSVTQIGAVAAYLNEGVGHYSLMDNSSNALHGIVSGATPLNLNIGVKQTAYLSTTSTTPTMTDVIPGGWKVNSISIETAQNLTVISATQETSSIALIAGKTLNNGKMVWSTMADHMLYASGTPKDIVFALTGNGGVGAKIYVELVRVF